PGRHLMVATAGEKSFSELNVAQLLGYRNISESEKAGQKTFIADFDLLQAIFMVPCLKDVAMSGTVRARQVSRHLYKTAAILLALNAGRGAFKPSPRTTLVSNAIPR